MRTNTKTPVKPVFTHEGGKGKRENSFQELERAVSSCFLWEGSFYENGVDLAERIKGLVPKCQPFEVAKLAISSRKEGKLRHVPLLIVREMARHNNFKPYVAEVLNQIIQRPDELAEFLSIYWKEGKCPIANSVKKGLARAFDKFNEYSLAKYNQNRDIKLRDVLFLVRPKPKSKEQESLWERLANNKLVPADTWENRLSASKGLNKKEVWEGLLRDKALGALALLRNLRNMLNANVSIDLIRDALKNCRAEQVLPFRFISAAKYAPQLEPELEALMFKSIPEIKLKGRTVLLIDVSGSMNRELSQKSELTRIEAANALAILLREICEDVTVYTFSNSEKLVPARRGFALRDAIMKQFGGSTRMKASMEAINARENYDRMITISDEQSEDGIGKVKGDGYLINVASYKTGVNYDSNVTHINGFSENVVNFILQQENKVDYFKE